MEEKTKDILEYYKREKINLETATKLLLNLHSVSCCDTCGKELTNIGGSQMYCHTCGTTKIGCN